MHAKLKNITAMLIFGSVGLFARNIPLPSAGIALVRGGIGTAVLAAAFLIGKRRLRDEPLKENLVRLFLSGAAMGFNWICLFQAYRYTTIATATLSYYLAPTFIVMLSPLVLHERLTPVRAICAAVSLFGMVLVSGVLTGDNVGSNNALGILFGATAAVLYAGVVLTNKFIHGLSAITLTAGQLLSATVTLLPYALLTGAFRGASLTAGSAALLLTVGVVHTGVAYLLYLSSLQSLKGQTTALLSYVDPVTAVLLSALVLKEPMLPVQILGAVLILGATLAGELLSARHTNASMTQGAS